MNFLTGVRDSAFSYIGNIIQRTLSNPPIWYFL
jgi:hypothetical protein